MIILSAVPPPVARSPCWWGDQAKALTAALWSVNLFTTCPEFVQTTTLLSLPPEQSCYLSGDHFNPQTYCLWPINFLTKDLGALGSDSIILLSLDPEQNVSYLQDITLTLF